MDFKNRLYPIFLKLEQLNILLVGAGNTGLEKLHSILSNSPAAKITIVAPEIKEEVRKLVLQHPFCDIQQRSFQEADLDGKDLIFLATNDRELHKNIQRMSSKKRIMINVADTPDLCDFYLGSIVQKGNLKIAISTNGQSPTAAKRIKEVLQSGLPAELDDVIENLQRIRKQLRGNFSDKVKELNTITRMLVEKYKE